MKVHAPGMAGAYETAEELKNNEKLRERIENATAGMGGKLVELDKSLGEKVPGFLGKVLKTSASAAALQGASLIGIPLTPFNVGGVIVGIDSARDIWAALTAQRLSVSERLLLGARAGLKNLAADVGLAGAAPIINELIPIRRGPPKPGK